MLFHSTYHCSDNLLSSYKVGLLSENYVLTFFFHFSEERYTKPSSYMRPKSGLQSSSAMRPSSGIRPSSGLRPATAQITPPSGRRGSGDLDVPKKKKNVFGPQPPRPSFHTSTGEQIHGLWDLNDDIL